MNHLEALTAEWLSYNDYFVRTTVRVGKRPGLSEPVNHELRHVGSQIRILGKSCFESARRVGDQVGGMNSVMRREERSIIRIGSVIRRNVNKDIGACGHRPLGALLLQRMDHCQQTALKSIAVTRDGARYLNWAIVPGAELAAAEAVPRRAIRSGRTELVPPRPSRRFDRVSSKMFDVPTKDATNDEVGRS